MLNSQPLANAGNGPSKTILVVDSDHSVRRLLCMVLQENGYPCMEAASGEEAQEVFLRASHAPDLLITDAALRDVSGLGLARTLVALRPSLQVVVISGSTYYVPIDRSWRFLPKPFVMKELVMCVMELLAKSQVRTKAAAG